MDTFERYLTLAFIAAFSVTQLVLRILDGIQKAINENKREKEAVEIARKAKEAADLVASKAKEAVDIASDDTKKITTEKVEEVKLIFQDSLESSNKKLDIIHTLVNSSNLGQKKLIWELYKKEADRTHSVDDMAAAKSAEDDYKKHKEQQDSSDKKKV